MNIAYFAKFTNGEFHIGYEEDKVFRSASLIKLFIALCLGEQLDKGSLSLKDMLVFDTKSVNSVDGTGALKFLEHENNFSVKELIRLMLAFSDNSATNMLIDYIGIETIQEFLQNNYPNTCMGRKMMQTPKSNKEDNLTTAIEVQSALEEIYLRAKSGESYYQEVLDILLKQECFNSLGMYIEDTAIAHKTGTLSQLEHDAGVVFLPEKEYTIAILVEGDSNQRCREKIGEISLDIYKEMEKNSERN